MLAKSRKSAFFMAVVFMATALIVAGIIVALRYPIGTFSLIDENVSGDDSDNMIALIIVILGLIFLLGYGLEMLSLWIYRGDDSHFGSKGAIRWAVTGAVSAILMQPASVLVPRPGSAKSAWLAGLYSVLRLCWGFFVFELSYRLVFKWFPLTRDQHIQQFDQSREGKIYLDSANSAKLHQYQRTIGENSPESRNQIGIPSDVLVRHRGEYNSIDYWTDNAETPQPSSTAPSSHHRI